MPTIDRNERARLMVMAEAYDRRTKTPGSHGGRLKRTGLAVFRALLFTFANAATGRCDPGYEALARAAGVARSTAAAALRRLEAAGLIARTRRQAGPVRLTNAYAFPTAGADGAAGATGRGSGGRGGGGGGGAGARRSAWSESRPETTNTTMKPNSARIGPRSGVSPPPWRSSGMRPERVKALLDALAARERRLGLA